MTNSVVSQHVTSVQKAGRVDYLWEHPGGDQDKNLWQNVEFVRN